MKKLLVCIDGSAYADNVVSHAAWAANRLNAEIDLLHVLCHPSDYEAPHDDHTGAIGLGARKDLMEELVKVDQQRAKLDQKKGHLILVHAEKKLKKLHVEKINPIHRRGSLPETIKDFENEADIIFIGKRGKQANLESEFLGSNLEKVARSIHKPLFLVSRYLRPIHKFLIAYDGKDNANKAVDFACSSKLLQGLDCHILTVGQSLSESAGFAVKKLQKSGYTITNHHETDGQVDKVIADYVAEKSINLLLTGAYAHSRVRTLLLGSTT